MEKIHIEQWDEKKFLNARESWNELLSRSKSDRLFLSWEWQSTWWKVFSEPENMALNLFVASTEKGEIVGIAPLFSSTVKTKNLLNTNRLQFIGNFWHGRTTMLTELLDFIVDSSNSTEIIKQLYKHIYDLKTWDEFIMPFLNSESDTYQILTGEDALPGTFIRHTERYESYYLAIDGNFQDYAKNLGKNTRLKLLNRRSMFEKLGDISFKNMQNNNIAKNLALLNDLHCQRWEKPIFENQRLQFNMDVAALLAEKNSLNFSTLSLNGKEVSIQYNFIVDGHNYNIQAGFDETFHKKISLGYLHFGYEIESSFENHFRFYDFLAGEGKNTQYKSRLTDTHHDMVDLQIIRSPVLKLLYKSHNLLTRFRQN